MKRDLQDMTYEITYYLELVIAIIMNIIIAVLTFKLLAVAVPEFFMGEKLELGYFLEKAMMLAIGLEFVKMLCKHTPSTIIDVLLFAIAKADDSRAYLYLGKSAYGSGFSSSICYQKIPALPF